MLQLEKKELEMCLEDAHREIDSLRMDKLLGSEWIVTKLKEEAVWPPNCLLRAGQELHRYEAIQMRAWLPVALVPSSRHKLPQLPQAPASQWSQQGHH